MQKDGKAASRVGSGQEVVPRHREWVVGQAETHTHARTHPYIHEMGAGAFPFGHCPRPLTLLSWICLAPVLMF